MRNWNIYQLNTGPVLPARLERTYEELKLAFPTNKPVLYRCLERTYEELKHSFLLFRNSFSAV